MTERLNPAFRCGLKKGDFSFHPKLGTVELYADPEQGLNCEVVWVIPQDGLEAGSLHGVPTEALSDFPKLSSEFKTAYKIFLRERRHQSFGKMP